MNTVEKTTILASDLRRNDLFEKDGSKYRIETISMDSHIVQMSCVGERKPIVLDRTDEVTKVVITADPKPYVVYTRLYKDNGDCDKRIHRFASRKAQDAFMSRTERAVTFYN